MKRNTSRRAQESRKIPLQPLNCADLPADSGGDIEEKYKLVKEVCPKLK